MTGARRSTARSPLPRAAWGPKQLGVAVLLALLVALSANSTFRLAHRNLLHRPTSLSPATEIVVMPKLLGPISRYLFGANLFWASDAEGAFDPRTSTFYPSFITTLRRLGVTVLRYPGGTTSDSFYWLRATGPEKQRLPNEPYGMQAASLSASCCVLDGPAPSAVGPDEFGRLLEATGAAGTVTVNFATGTARQAADFVAYMTAPASTHPSRDPSQASYWAGLRSRDGHPAPYDVPYWEVGNEQYFPGQFGWRAGRFVKLGPHATRCPKGELATCLYAFGGTTAFADEAVGTFADELPGASYSTGAPDQTFYVYYPPIVPHSATVYVAGRPWAAVADLSQAGPGARVYALDPATGEITFGDGVHGKVPPQGAKVTASYESGPHGGFVEFYRAMKAMNRHITICESEGANLEFLELMGHKYPYDCVQMHDYARPPDVLAPLREYEQQLMAFPVREGKALVALQSQVYRYAGRNIPIFVTEYGQLAAPVPAADPGFNLSLDEGLLIGAQLVEWADHGVPVAEKYLLDSSPFGRVRAVTLISEKGLRLRTIRGFDRHMVATGLSIASAMVAHAGNKFVPEPTGQVIGLMAHLAGSERLRVLVHAGPMMNGGMYKVPALWVIPGISRTGRLWLVAINADPVHAVTARVALKGFRHASWLNAVVLDGPAATSYNTLLQPREVTTTAIKKEAGKGELTWSFPAHSLSLLLFTNCHATG